MTYLIITHISEFAALLGVYREVEYCCAVIFWKPGVLRLPLIFLFGEVGSDLKLNWSDILSIVR